MADISKVSIDGGLTEYNISDDSARSRLDSIEDKIPSVATSSNKLVDQASVNTALSDKADKSSVGANNGIASLDSSGRVPSSQLPSYVDDVLEYNSLSSFPATGESGKIYVALDTNKTYRWGGSDYVEISESLALGETSSTAYAGNKGKANADAITAIQGMIPNNASSSNKFATANEIGNLADLETTAKNNLVAAINEAAEGGRDITISDETLIFS